MLIQFLCDLNRALFGEANDFFLKIRLNTLTVYLGVRRVAALRVYYANETI